MLHALDAVPGAEGAHASAFGEGRAAQPYDGVRGRRATASPSGRHLEPDAAVRDRVHGELLVEHDQLALAARASRLRLRAPAAPSPA